MPPIIHRLSYGLIIFALIALVSGPAFGAVVYFGNISDWPQTPGKPIGSATSLSCSDIPEPVRTYLSNMGQYTGVPAAFLAGIAKTESGFVNPTTNLDIAWGIMQLSHSPYQVWQEQDALYRNDYEKNFANFKTGTTIQPPSQAKPRVRTGNIAVDPFNEEYNVYIGSKYIWWLRGHYLPAAGNDDTKLFSYVAAAYNGGWPAFDNTKYTLSRMDKETIEYVPKVMTAYQDYKARCQKDLTPIATAAPNPSSSARGQTIADEAKKQLGKQSVCKFGASANEGCTSFVKDVLDTNAQANFNLDAPKAWSQPEGIRTKGTNGIQAGDAVFWVVPDNKEFSTKDLNQTDFPPGTEVPSHVGIYIGDYTGPDYFDSSGNGQQVHYTNAVAANSSRYGRIVVRDLGLYPVYGYKRY